MTITLTREEAQQPKALWLADVLTEEGESWWEDAAAAELRRLHEVNVELVEALNQAIDSIGRFTSEEGSTARDFDIMDNCIAALAKAQGDNNGD